MAKNKTTMMANFTYCEVTVVGPNRVRRMTQSTPTNAIEPVIKTVFMIMAPRPPCRRNLVLRSHLTDMSMMPLRGTSIAIDDSGESCDEPQCHGDPHEEVVALGAASSGSAHLLYLRVNLA